MLKLAGRRLLQIADISCFVHHVASSAILIAYVGILNNVVISALHIGPCSHICELIIVSASIEVSLDT